MAVLKPVIKTETLMMRKTSQETKKVSAILHYSFVNLVLPEFGNLKFSRHNATFVWQVIRLCATFFVN